MLSQNITKLRKAPGGTKKNVLTLTNRRPEPTLLPQVKKKKKKITDFSCTTKCFLITRLFLIRKII